MPETQTANLPTFESVWASFQESRKEMQEFGKKMEELRESQKETARQ
jgi:uncharacterized membrane protein (DUF106 family)